MKRTETYKERIVGNVWYLFSCVTELCNTHVGAWVDFDRRVKIYQQRLCFYSQIDLLNWELNINPSILLDLEEWRRRDGSSFFSIEFHISILCIHFGITFHVYRNPINWTFDKYKEGDNILNAAD